MTDRLSESELANRSGVTVEELRRLVNLGILRSEDGVFQRSDVMRARVVTQLAANGIEVEALAAALASGHLELGYLESAGRRFPRSERTFAEVAEDMGVPVPTLENIYVAFGLPRPAADEAVREEDLVELRGVGILFAAGLDDDEVIRMARVWGDNARRVAQYLTHHFHNVVEERFRLQGLGDNQAYEAALWEVGLRIGRSGEDLLGWLFRRHSETFQTEHQFGHVETALELAGVRRRTPRGVETAVFADLSGYTELTEEAGDDAAAEVAVTFAQLAGEVAARHGGDVVKLLGDGVFLRFEDPDQAVLASLDLVESTAGRGLPEAHIGVNSGPMLYDQGDYFGRTINLAARIASQAGPGQVYLGESVTEIVSANGFELTEVGEFDLKGISTPVRIHRAVRTSVF
ncbi:MAG TPA: adenylate/guanylate cyclase domain-containing protein [Acidimicrobiia bacterium]|nr:adenylate/guanylate cyclase domain-containing protein [Acidimicrobiia bacterium]